MRWASETMIPSGPPVRVRMGLPAQSVDRAMHTAPKYSLL
jgi:hypothetical protein